MNQGNLDVHLDIPIRHKAGRGQDFTYDLSYDSSVWTPVTSGSTTTWQPSGSWGWAGLSQAGIAYAGYSMTTSSGTCGQFGQGSWQSWTFNSVFYSDERGVQHQFNASGSSINSPGGTGCPPPGAQPSIQIPTPASDGSGIVLTWSINQGSMSLSFTAKDGTNINPPIFVNSSPTGTGNYLSADMNGNEISMSNGVVTDTLGQTALTIVGTAPANTTLYFANPTGTSTYTVTYGTYKVKTNFQCSGVTEYTNQTAYLVNSVELPDGTQYLFSYEATPGYSGYSTGRPASVTLPSGGTISYGYNYSDGHNGIECADGSASGLTRGTPDGTWTYTRSGSGTQWTTTIQAPAYGTSGTQDQQLLIFLREVRTSTRSLQKCTPEPRPFLRPT